MYSRSLCFFFLIQAEIAMRKDEADANLFQPLRTLSSAMDRGGFHGPTRLVLFLYEDYIKLVTPRVFDCWKRYYHVRTGKEIMPQEFVIGYIPEGSTTGSNSDWKKKTSVTVLFPLSKTNPMKPGFECLEFQVCPGKVIPFPGCPQVNMLVRVQGNQSRKVKSRNRQADKKKKESTSAVTGACAPAEEPTVHDGAEGDEKRRVKFPPKQSLFVHTIILCKMDDGRFSRWDYVVRLGKNRIPNPHTNSWATQTKSALSFEEGEILAEHDLQLNYLPGDYLWLVFNEQLHAGIVLQMNLDKRAKLCLVAFENSSSPGTLG